jgi:hypothetical protein
VDHDDRVYPQDFRSIVKRAVHCDDCFRGALLTRALIDRAQPRLIGSEYWGTRPRIVFLSINPGSGEGRHDRANTRMRDLIHCYAADNGALEDILEHQKRDFPNWGNGKFSRFLALAGLQPNKLAFANVAWCATKNDQYPPAMLRNCMQKHTSPLIKALAPDVVVLSGSAAHAFYTQVRQTVPNARIHCTLHYAHRKGRQASLDAASRLRKELSGFEE